MFTGLVQDIGAVKALTSVSGALRLRIGAAFDMREMPLGASVCCSGVCLTVIEKTDHEFVVEASEETLRRTTVGSWDVQTRINLEPSLRLGSELGGHFVFGHVDATAQILDITQEGASYNFTIAVPPALAPFIAQKGSVALDGVSLTVNWVEGARFGVTIIPHTWEKTTLSARKRMDYLNLEVDMLARYAARILEFKS